MSKFIDKLSSYFVVSYVKQTPAVRFGLLLCYGTAILIAMALIIATLGLLLT